LPFTLMMARFSVIVPVALLLKDRPPYDPLRRALVTLFKLFL